MNSYFLFVYVIIAFVRCAFLLWCFFIYVRFWFLDVRLRLFRAQAAHLGWEWNTNAAISVGTVVPVPLWDAPYSSLIICDLLTPIRKYPNI